MKYALPLILSLGLFLLGACTVSEAKKAFQPAEIEKKGLAVPVGKNWQVKEEAPKLGNERNDRLPFQTEQSVQPAGTQQVSPADNRKIETPTH